MPHLFKQPLTWMVLFEMVVVAALVVVAWRFMAGGVAVVAPQIFRASPAPGDTPAPFEPAGVVEPPSAGARPELPGLNVDAAFWRARLAGLNQAEQQVEALEWRIVHSAMDTVHRYIESVVIPAVLRAEGR